MDRRLPRCLLFLVPGLCLLMAQEARAELRRYLVLVVAGYDHHQAVAENAVELIIARLAQEEIEPVGPEGLTRDYPDRSTLRRCAVDLGCICRAARTMGADRVLLGLMSQRGEKIDVTLEVIDALERRSIARTAANLDEGEFAPRILELASALLQELEGTAEVGATLVLSIEGASARRILFDGKPVGSGRAWTGEGLELGEHELLLELEDGSTLRRSLSLGKGRKELTLRLGDAALPHERHLQKAEAALFEGKAGLALTEVRAALRDQAGAQQGAVHLMLGRVCLSMLLGTEPSAELLDQAFDAVRRASDLMAGPEVIQLRAELARHFARVRLEPGPGWTQPGSIHLRELGPSQRGSRPALLRSIASRLDGQKWHLPAELRLPRPGRYRINGQDLILGQQAESRLRVLALPARQMSISGPVPPALSLLAAPGDGGIGEVYGGLAAQLFPWCSEAACLGGRVEASVKVPSSGRGSSSRSFWLSCGPGLSRLLLSSRLRVDLSLAGLWAPGSAELGLGMSGAAGWLLGAGLRLGLRPSWSFFDLQVEGSTLGVQVELSYEL